MKCPRCGKRMRRVTTRTVDRYEQFSIGFSSTRWEHACAGRKGKRR
jgi:hypothetical protein